MCSLNSNSDNINTFTEKGFKVLIEATKNSNKLPFGKGRDLYESYPCFNNVMKIQSKRVLGLLSKLMKHAGCRANIHKRDDEERIELIIETNDCILEKVGRNLDEILGISKNPDPNYASIISKPVSGSWNQLNTGNRLIATQILSEVLDKTKNMDKPQLYFSDKVDNDRKSIFQPKIKYKHNMLKPLSIIEEINEDGQICFSHPYQFELDHFKPPESQLTCVEPILYKPLEETHFEFITTVEGVKSMICNIKNCKEIAVDLEHHSYRSFEGFTCLIQISTRDTDYVVDSIALRNNLEELNEIFTDPNIVKVFHGSIHDILWLQRDFGIYVVNLFDTYYAAKLLEFSVLSLAYLVQRFCNVILNKQFRLADWRVRPLPDELIKYAREDTHYLLYVYDRLKNMLLEKASGKTNLLESVFSESVTVCLQRYVKPVWNENGYLGLYHRSKKLFDNRQKYALKELFDWRDKTARKYDESHGYVLPNHMMLSISETLPREAQGILACCNPIPVLVKKDLLNLHQIIHKAREQPLVQPVFEERRFYRSNAEDDLSIHTQLHCPHDLNFDGEFRDDLPVLLIKDGDAPDKLGDLRDLKLVASDPVINIFDTSKERKPDVLSNICKSSLLTPYERYKLTKPFNEKNEAALAFSSKETSTGQAVETQTVKSETKEESPSESLTVKIKEENRRKRKLASAEDVPKKVKCVKPNKAEDNQYAADINSEANGHKKIRDVQPFNYSAVNFDHYQSYRGKKPRKQPGNTSKPWKFRKK